LNACLYSDAAVNSIYINQKPQYSTSKPVLTAGEEREEMASCF